MRVLIAGANGFVGRNLLLGLGAGRDLYGVDLGPGLEEFVRRRGLAGVRCAACDLADREAVAALARDWGDDFDAVVYLAGNGDPARSVADPAFDLRSAPLSLVTFLSAFRARRFVYFSSGAVYDRIRGAVSPRTPVEPVLPYAVGKYACERYIRFFRERERIGSYVVLRFFGAYGPWEPARKIYTRLVRRFALERRPDFEIRGDGSNLIDAMYVEDAVRAVGLVLDSGVADRTVDFCVGSPLTLRALVETAAREFGLEPDLRCRGTVPEYIEFRPSPEEMRELFGFRPEIPLNEGLRRLAEHLRAATFGEESHV
ncbi:MAG TPA: NAD(P)-dependent oxidoreductase [bacterium]|nr:NAD(P)-dependent oxidoreductase [bacterium]HPJ71721.1 NAD(P)-dependent oxidoreductase [bacterium]HPQ66599.1 NAD(P)-dependent oxidoreductase [bacterium]